MATNRPRGASQRLPSTRAILVCSWVLATLLTACGGKSQPGDDLPPPATYEVRGLVRTIKEQSIGSTQLSIHHEAMPDFVGIKGQVEGMKSMTMPFTVAESVDLDGITPGTKILFQLTVDWSAPEPALITAIEVLPPESTLQLESSG